MQAKTEPAAPPAPEKPYATRTITRELGVCTFAECDHKFEPQRRTAAALRDAIDHAVKSGHIYTRTVKVERELAVVRERIIDE